MTRPRTLLRAVSRDAQRNAARPNLNPGIKRAQQRHNHWRGPVADLVRGPHDRARLFSGTVNGGGQARINAKRNARAQFWAEFATGAA